MKIATLIVLALALLLGPIAGALLATSGPDPGCGCIDCECGPPCECAAPNVTCQLVDHVPPQPHRTGIDPFHWHPQILDTAKDLDVAAKKFGHTCDKISGLADGALGHAYSAGAWTAGPIALILGIVLGCVLCTMARGKPPKV